MSGNGKPILASAPGKIFLGGEYAVLCGAEAVVTAVDRRVTAKIPDNPPSASSVLTEVRKRVLDFLGEESSAYISRCPIRLKSDDFQIASQKIGLGSSAAVAASSTGAFFERAGFTIGENRREILTLAIAAHRASQMGRGSGADVAASVVGGTIIFTMDGKVEPVDLGGVVLVPVWSGHAASTTALIRKIDLFATQDPCAHRDCMDDLKREAKEIAQAYRAGDPQKIIQTTKSYGGSLDRLGRASGAEIVTSELGLIANLADNCGGAAKPSGAGGGDVAVAVFDDQDGAKRFRVQCVRYELTPLGLKTNAPGLQREFGS